MPSLKLRAFFMDNKINEISKKRLELAERNLDMFRYLDIVAAMVTGSAAKGYADDNSDIDTLIVVDRKLTPQEFDNIVADAKASGGDLYHGNPEDGFAVYYYIDGIKCDFGIGDYRETEKLITEMQEGPEIDLIKHLQIAGFIDGYDLKGQEWINEWRQKAQQFPAGLQDMMVTHFKKFHPEWVLHKMAIERGDNLFYYESLIEAIGNIIGILCGLNKMYHPGKLKGVEWSINEMAIKPNNFIERYNRIFSIEKSIAVKELYTLITETLDLIDLHLPQVSTERSRKLLDMELRK